MTMPLNSFNRDEDQLNLFYGSSWQNRNTTLDQYEYSGYILGEQIRSGERVIHVNCGNNPFKGMIPNFLGIDPANSAADYVITLEDYTRTHNTTKFNVAFCLNAFDNGTEDYIESQVASVVQLMVKRDARIYWRTNTAGTYHWTVDAHTRLAAMFNYRVVGATAETGNNIYAEWDSNITTLSEL
jgi:hypothetical protein